MTNDPISLESDILRKYQIKKQFIVLMLIYFLMLKTFQIKESINEGYF